MSDFLPEGLRIVHEDRDLIVVDKPAGLLTAGEPGTDVRSAFREIKKHVRDKAKRRGTQVWIIHRLDKEASGLLVFAKTEKAFEWLKEQFRTKRAHRLYTAVAEGTIGTGSAAHSGTIQSFLFEDEDGVVRSEASPIRRDSAGRPMRTEGKLAVSHYRVLGAGKSRTLLQVRLETGRKNQIRVHFQYLGHPLVGDRRYGAATDPIERLCLHASELGFAHPATGQTARFTSPPPPAFKRLVGSKTDTSAEPFEQDTPAPAPLVDHLSVTPLRSTTKPLPESLAGSATAQAGDQSWDHVAGWYQHLIEERGSDHHERVILPGVVRLLEPRAGERVLDVACGEGSLCRRLAVMGVNATGVDAARNLIATAAAILAPHNVPPPEYHTADARQLESLGLAPFDGAACVMALMNIEPVSLAAHGVAAALRTGGRFVAVILHPAFRSPGQTSWGWAREGDSPDTPIPMRQDGPPRRAPDDRKRRPGKYERPSPDRFAPVVVKQFRRVEGYLSSAHREIVMNPGAVAKGKAPITTITYHRPLQHYVQSLAAAGLYIDALEEWASLRTSERGPTAEEENRIRREIPMFLAIRAVKITR
jgi:23S rRNA pseudouridine1911/1915/1917 synthase